MINRTSLLLTNLFYCNYKPADAKTIFASEQLRVVAPYGVPRGIYFLHGGFPADTVFFLLQGSARVVSCTPDGREAVVDVVDAPHILGATEVIQHRELFAASVAAATDCLMARVSAEEFLSGLRQCPKASDVMIRYLAWLASYNMDKSELKALAQPKALVGRYLYLASVGRPLPCVLAGTRKSLSEELHINLRTLYRYLSQLNEDGYIDLVHGKIVISAKGLRKLEALYRESFNFG